MTQNKAQKAAIRQRMEETGEPYSVAARRATRAGDAGPADPVLTGLTAEERYAREAEAAGIPAAQIEAQRAAFQAQERADRMREAADLARQRADQAEEAADQAEERAELAHEAADLARDWADEAEQGQAQARAEQAQRAADEARGRADQADEAADEAAERAELAQEAADLAQEAADVPRGSSAGQVLRATPHHAVTSAWPGSPSGRHRCGWTTPGSSTVMPVKKLVTCAWSRIVPRAEASRALTRLAISAMAAGRMSLAGCEMTGNCRAPAGPSTAR